MARRSFWLNIFCWMLTCYAFCCYVFWPYSWSWAPPRDVILILTLFAFVAGILGFQAKGCWLTFRSLSTVFFSFILAFLLLMTIVIPWFKYIRTSLSPQQDHRIKVYFIDLGAPSPTTYDIYLEGPLWAKRRIFTAGKVQKSNGSTMTLSWLTVIA